MTISDEEVKRQINFKEFFKREFPEKYRSNGNSHAPFREDKKPSFQLNDTFGYDHTTGESWDVYSIRQKTHGLDFQEAKQSLMDEYGITDNGRRKTNLKPKAKTEFGRRVAEYPYYDENGNLLYYNIRTDPKAFFIEHPHPEKPGKRKWGRGKAKPVPFGLLELLAAPAAETVFDVEGEKDCLAMRELGFVAVSCGSATAGPKLLRDYDGTKYFRGRNVVIIEDNDRDGKETGAVAAREKAKELVAVAKSVKILKFPDDDVKDAYDFIAKYNGEAKNRIVSLADITPPYAPLVKAANEKAKADAKINDAKTSKTRKPKGLQKFQKLDLCVQSLGWKLFFDQTNEPWAGVKINGHVENLRISSKTFKRQLQKEFKAQFDDGVGADHIDQVIGAALGEIEQTEEPRHLYYRSTWDETGDKIWIDSGRADWSVYEIDGEGWRIICPETNPFKRERSFAAYQCNPDTPRATWGNLFEFLPIKDEGSQGLIKLWLTLALFPDTPRPGLVINGPEGSGKTTLAKKIRGIIDPMTSEKPNRLWNQEENLIVALSRKYINIFDNSSVMTKDSSDILCQSITGGQFEKRARYTDGDIHNIDLMVTWIITGITNPAKMPDFMSRVFIVESEIIEEQDKRPDSYIDRLSDKYRAGLQALIFDCISEALRNVESVKPKKLHRLAQANLYTLAMTETLGLDPDAIHELWEANKKQQDQEVEDKNFMVGILEEFVGKLEGYFWQGKLAELIDTLYEEFGLKDKPWRKSFPSEPAAMGKALRGLMGAMDAKGVCIKTKRQSGGQQITIFKHGYAIETKPHEWIKATPERFEQQQKEKAESENKPKQSVLLDNVDNAGDAGQDQDNLGSPNNVGSVGSSTRTYTVTYTDKNAESLDNAGMSDNVGKIDNSYSKKTSCFDGCEYYAGENFYCLKLKRRINPEQCGVFDKTADLG